MNLRTSIHALIACYFSASLVLIGRSNGCVEYHELTGTLSERGEPHPWEHYRPSDPNLHSEQTSEYFTVSLPDQIVETKSANEIADFFYAKPAYCASWVFPGHRQVVRRISLIVDIPVFSIVAAKNGDMVSPILGPGATASEYRQAIAMVKRKGIVSPAQLRKDSQVLGSGKYETFEVFVDSKNVKHQITGLLVRRAFDVNAEALDRAARKIAVDLGVPMVYVD